MVRAVLFDLFETLITESGTRPAGVSSLAPRFQCERSAFRTEWKAIRPAVTVGRQSFGQALAGIVAALGGRASQGLLSDVCNERIRIKAEPFARAEPEIVAMLDAVRSRDLRLGVISNCFAGDVEAWPQSPFASRVDCTVFSFAAGVAKPDPLIYLEAARRLQVDVSETLYIGDGQDDELAGAERAGLRAFKALWFLKRWPHYRERPPAGTDVSEPADVVRLLA